MKIDYVDLHSEKTNDRQFDKAVEDQRDHLNKTVFWVDDMLVQKHRPNKQVTHRKPQNRTAGCDIV